MAIPWWGYALGGVVVIGVGYGIAQAVSARSTEAPEYQPQPGGSLPPAQNADAEIARGAFGVVDRLITVVSDKVRRDDEARASNNNAKREDTDDGHTEADNIAAINRKRAA